MSTSPSSSGELVSQLQDELGKVAAMFFNYVGALQRDAPPSSVAGESLAAKPGEYDVEGQTDVMAGDLLKGMRDLERLIRQLPDVQSSEAAQIEEVVQLQAENAQASTQLQGALEAAQTQLRTLQDAHGLLADAALRGAWSQQQQQLPPAG